jgi:hypothetical protein
MKMARANKTEWQNLMDFANAYEELTPRFSLVEPSDTELADLFRKYKPEFFRVVFGYATLVDNFCDLNASSLEVRPDIAEVFSKTGFKLKGGNFFGED